MYEKNISFYYLPKKCKIRQDSVFTCLIVGMDVAVAGCVNVSDQVTKLEHKLAQSFQKNFSFHSFDPTTLLLGIRWKKTLETVSEYLSQFYLSDLNIRYH